MKSEQKLLYLKQHITGDPLEYIRHIPVNNDGFETAINYMDKVWGDPIKIATAETTEFLKWASEPHGNTIQEWRNDYSKLSSLGMEGILSEVNTTCNSFRNDSKENVRSISSFLAAAS